MNELNLLENQLRSWTPRSPSAKLKSRLFPEREAVRPRHSHSFGGRWAWLAPVMGCFFILMVVSGPRGSQYLSGTRPTDWLAMVASNQGYAAYIVADFHSEQNSLQREPIQWNSEPRVSVDRGSLPAAVTNSLMR